MLAAFRMLARLAGRDVRTSASLAMNNLFFLVVLLLQGSNPRTMGWTLFPFAVLLGLPLLLAFSGDPVQKIPATRLALWPLTTKERIGLRLFALGLTPAVWLAVLLLLIRAGVGMALAFFAALTVMQAVVIGIAYGLKKSSKLQVRRYVPQPPGRLGGVCRLSLRQMMMTLDFYVALTVSVGGAIYRWSDAHADPAAYPVLAMVVALALSTYAQRMFGFDGPVGETRYRLLPLRGWKLLFAKDAAYLGVLALLVLPLGVLPGLAFGLISLATGRYASLTSAGVQQRWRFVGGDLPVGVLQVLAGVGAGFASLRFGVSALCGCVAIYLVSLVVGGRVWEKDIGRVAAATKRARRRRLARGW
ncbi:MAG: hypothetical protein M3Y13_05750 [Armatimonadota bacterium]|nr:hypothetical protein [Armatimonadota bacterium]